jgi:hypothetical protein
MRWGDFCRPKCFGFNARKQFADVLSISEQVRQSQNTMLAYDSVASSSGHDAPPACPWKGNSHRPVSLWAIVNEFKAADLCLRVGNFAVFESIFMTALTSDADWGQLKIDFISEVIQASTDCETAGITGPVTLFNRIQENLLQHSSDPAAWAVEAKHAKAVIVDELRKRRFLDVRPDRCEYLEQEALFGVKVNDQFRSASRDIKEAGNCLAAENGTGAVFHLMRAAEVALRVLAIDRGVQYPDASVNSKQVGDLLSALDGKMSGLRLADGKLWPSRDIKDAQLNFYHRAIVEFRDFNEAWRKHMAHAHEGSFYDRDQALSIFKHVKECMCVLAEKISESATTPLYWTAA